jgi:hypothetical protein
VVIHIVDKIGNSFLNIFHSSISPKVDLLGFQGFYKTLSIGIIIGVSLPAHADLKSMDVGI